MSDTPLSFTCPYCDHSIPAINEETVKIYALGFDRTYSLLANLEETEDCVLIKFLKCAKCGKYIISAVGAGTEVKFLEIPLSPHSKAIKFPDYIPKQIREDYEEACAIVHLSPKASATLSRRCLQSMIRDYWGITKSRLVDEINELSSKVQPTEKKVLDALRELGNIGAHPEKDINTIVEIEPGEAEKMIKVIELFLKEWYIQRHDRQKLFDDVLDISNSKK